VATQNLYAVKVQQILKPGAFRPSPRVDSIVLEFHRLPQPRVALKPEEQKRFSALVKAAFSHRRKTLENSLGLELSRLGWVTGKAALKAALQKSGIDGIRRAETLSIEEYGKLCQALA
jgi:16S rRNA (adenine1518-N6/adenine1519-N6)-dimethyltransferase